MAQLDSLLRIVVNQGADELRLGSDRSPAMSAGGVPKKLTIPATNTATLLDLFGELIDADRRAALARTTKVEFVHEAPGVGPFRVTLVSRGGEDGAFDAVVRRGAAPAVASPAVAVPLSGAVDGPSATLAPSTTPVSRGSAPSHVTGPAVPSAASSSSPDAPPPGARMPDASLGRVVAGRATADAALAALLVAAAERGASDLHLADGEAPAVRVDGTLGPLGGHAAVPLATLLEGLLSPAQLTQLADQRSCDVAVDLEGGRRARMNVFRTLTGLAAAVRFLPRAPRAFAELGLPPDLEDLAELSSGLVLATGATGSGKSTTLAALASLALRRRSIVLVTLEDPIEYVFEPAASSLVRQRQLGREFADFPSGLRDALRADPDVVLIGEMRDAESIALALTAAETGHLVLASLHARSAVSAIDRILDATPGDRQAQVRQQLADALRAVVAQRLLPREGGGRVLAAEVLRNVPAVAMGIREGKSSTLRTAMQSGRGAGMVTLERALADLVQSRAISVETARRQANDPQGLLDYLASR